VDDAALISSLCSRIAENGAPAIAPDRETAVEMVAAFVLASLTNRNRDARSSKPPARRRKTTEPS
jgi:hypothetical protein